MTVCGRLEDLAAADDQIEEDTMATLLGGPGRIGDSADQDLDREHPPDRHPRSCTHHAPRPGLGQGTASLHQSRRIERIVRKWM